MMEKKSQSKVRKNRFRTGWGELEYVCKRVHAWLYQRRNQRAARRYLRRLERVLGELPQNDEAILKEEGLALLHELKGENEKAIKHRHREIRLMEKLHDLVNSEAYDHALRESILLDRDTAALNERKIILQNLQKAEIQK